MERSPTETAHLVDSHYSRSFGRPPDNEMREFIRNAAEHGLTADELINCMTAAVVTYGFGAYERDYRKVFVAEARKIWKMKNGKKKASLLIDPYIRGFVRLFTVILTIDIL